MARQRRTIALRSVHALVCLPASLRLVVLDQANGVLRHKTAYRTTGLGQRDDGSIWSQDEPRSVEIPRFVVHVATDGPHRLSSIEPMYDRVGELVSIHRFLGLLFRVNGERYDPALDLFEPFDALLKISQLLTAECSPMAPVEEQDTPASSSMLRQGNFSVCNGWASDRRKLLTILQSCSFV